MAQLPDLRSATFNTLNSSAATYAAFRIEVVRQIDCQERYYGIPMLPDLRIDDRANHMLFHMVNDSALRISLIVRRSDLYIVGYVTQSTVWYFEHTTEEIMESIFPGFTVEPIGCDARYSSLEHMENVGPRTSYTITLNSINISITGMYYMEERKVEATLGKGILTFVQMICEGVRFPLLARKFASVFRNAGYYCPTISDCDYMTNWGSLSQGIVDAYYRRSEMIQPMVEVAGEYVSTLGRARQMVSILKRPIEGR